jgi:hypothetical protein
VSTYIYLGLLYWIINGIDESRRYNISPEASFYDLMIANSVAKDNEEYNPSLAVIILKESPFFYFFSLVVKIVT